MKKVYMAGLLASCLTLPAYGWGIKDLKKAVEPDLGKCDGEKHDTTCKAKEIGTSAATVAAVGLAAKLLADMVVDYKSRQVTSAEEVRKIYIATYKEQPKKPEVMRYNGEIKGGKVMQIGKPITVVSDIMIATNDKTKALDLKEKLVFQDPEDPENAITATKVVNKNKELGGEFDNEFTFTLPVGMPQGIYKVDQVLVVDGKEVKTIKDELQLAVVYPNGTFEILAAR